MLEWIEIGICLATLAYAVVVMVGNIWEKPDND